MGYLWLFSGEIMTIDDNNNMGMGNSTNVNESKGTGKLKKRMITEATQKI